MNESEKNLTDMSGDGENRVEEDVTSESDVLNNEGNPPADVEKPNESDDGYTTDEDDIAYVAERITGARHTRAATAAPIRVREQGETMKLNSLSRRLGGGPEEGRDAGNGGKAHEVKKAEARKRKRRVFLGSVFAAALAVVLLSTVVVCVNVAAEKSRPADLNIGETEGEAKVIGDGGQSPVKDKPDTAPESKKDEGPSDDGSESESESGSQSTEPENETEPDTAPPETDPPETEPAPTYNVTLDFYTREDINIDTEKTTLAALLELCGVVLEEGEVPSIPLDYTIAADTVVTVDKYEYQTVTETEEVPFSSQVTKTDLIPRGEKNYSQHGEVGQVNKYYTAEIVNGVERSRTLEREETVKSPVDEIYEEGVGGTIVGSDGVEYSYSMRRVVPATYYSIEGITYLGTMADESVVAVNQDYIPLGTKLYVKNDSYDFGVRIASDVGGGIDGYEVDIWLSDSNPQKAAFAQVGYHNDMEIYYLD